jgi:hypothetical protein
MERFIAARGGPIRHADRELIWTYQLHVSTRDIVRVRFRDYVRDPVQGLAIDCADCEVRIAEQAGTKFQVWTDSAPESFAIHVWRAKPGAQLKFFNVWGDASHSPMMYRLNNAAILVESQGTAEAVLRCSDGMGELQLDDLVVEIYRQAQVV